VNQLRFSENDTFRFLNIPNLMRSESVIPKMMLPNLLRILYCSLGKFLKHCRYARLANQNYFLRSYWGYDFAFSKKRFCSFFLH